MEAAADPLAPFGASRPDGISGIAWATAPSAEPPAAAWAEAIASKCAVDHRASFNLEIAAADLARDPAGRADQNPSARKRPDLVAAEAPIAVRS